MFGSTFIVSLSVAMVTAFAMYLDLESIGPALYSAITIAHLLAGTVFGLLLLCGVTGHIRNFYSVRRLGLNLSGWLLSVASIIAILSGGWLLGYGSAQRFDWVSVAHLFSSLIMLVLLALHSGVFFRQHGRMSNVVRHRRSSAGVLSQAIPGLLVLLPVVYFTVSDITMRETSGEPAVVNYQYVYGPNAFAPAETTTESEGFLGLQGIGESHRCFSCHRDISRQWASSSHGKAASGAAYAKNISLLVEKKGIAAARYCEGCHAPVALLTGELSEGGLHGGVAGSPGNTEGVSCLSCHAVDSVSHVLGNGSFVAGEVAKDPALFSENGWVRALAGLALRSNPSRHQAELSSDLLTESRICASCHSQFMDSVINSWGWVKMQDEYSAWLSSGYSGRTDRSESLVDVQMTCQDCHMPLVRSKDPAADSAGLVRSHRFAAANTFLPALDGDEVQLQAVKQFLSGGKVVVSIVQPHRPEAPRNRLNIQAGIDTEEEAPSFAYIGESLSIDVAVSNRFVGHDFPGGTIDINEVWIEFIATDATGEVVYSSGTLNADGSRDSSAYVYGNVPVDREGKHVWQHDLFNMIGESFKRTIKPGATDLASYRFRVPSWAQSPLTLHARLNYRKFNKRYTDWVVGASMEFPVVEMSWDTLQLPLAVRRAVVDNADNPRR